MGRLANFVLLMGGVTLSYYLSGLIGPESSLIIKFILSVSTVPSGVLFALLFAGVSIVGAIAGFLRNPSFASRATIIIPLFIFFFDFIGVFNVTSQANPILALIVIAPLMLLFTFTVFEWIGGTD